MFKYKKQTSLQKELLYNKILSLSRDKVFYTKFNLIDTFQNRIHLIFIHISYLFIKSKKNKENVAFKSFNQEMFDLIFNKIELNMREIGYGDVTVNKNMKFLIKTFYNILLNCESYKKLSFENKLIFLNMYLQQDPTKNIGNNAKLVDYFNQYESFCFDLSPDSVLNGDLKFNYK